MLKMVDGVEVEMTPEEVDDLTNGSPPPPARKSVVEALLEGLVAVGKLTEEEAAAAKAAQAGG